MNQIILLLSICLLVGFQSCKQDNSNCTSQTSNTNTIQSNATGQFTVTTCHNDIERTYILYVPSTYSSSVGAPIVFNFHGFGGQANDHIIETNMRSIADTAGFILVCPQGALLDGSPHWNTAEIGPGNKSSIDDLGFFDWMLDEIMANYSVDAQRVYVCGYSNGSFFSYALACQKSHRIAGVGSVSGAMLDDTLSCSPSHPTAIIHMHGTNDGVVAYNGTGEYPSVNTAINYWTSYNMTTTTPSSQTVTSNGLTIERFFYGGGTNDVAVVLYKVNGGDHVWFDMAFNGASTSELIWQFLSQYDINGRR